MTLYEKISLPNGLTLEIWDASRDIAADTTKVELVAQMEVAFDPSYLPTGEGYEKLVRTLGNQSRFEYRMVRSFVKSPRKDDVFKELLAAFKQDSLSYFSKDDFARRFTLSRLRDIELNPYRYQAAREEM